jgi:hypothetical protein
MPKVECGEFGQLCEVVEDSGLPRILLQPAKCNVNLKIYFSSKVILCCTKWNFFTDVAFKLLYPLLDSSVPVQFCNTLITLINCDIRNICFYKENDYLQFIIQIYIILWYIFLQFIISSDGGKFL